MITISYIALFFSAALLVYTIKSKEVSFLAIFYPLIVIIICLGVIIR